MISVCLLHYDPELSPLKSTAVQENYRGSSEVSIIIHKHYVYTVGNQKS